MATLVEDGYRPSQLRVMHPFFSQGTNECDDGESFAHPREERQPPNPKPQVEPVNARPAISFAADNHQPNRKIVTLTIPKGRYDDLKAITRDAEIREVDSFEVDPNQDRRKRRKVTPTTSIHTEHEPGREASTSVHVENELCHKASATDTASTETQAWIQQLEEAASEGNIPTSLSFTDAVDDSASSLLVMNNETARQDQEENYTTPCAPASPTPDNTSAEEIDRPSTPENMAKRNGSILTSTPKRVKKTSAVQKPSPRPLIRQGGNLTFKNGRLTKSLRVVIDYKNVSNDASALCKKIETILTTPRIEAAAVVLKATAPVRGESKATKPAKTQKSVHPFFFGNPAAKSEKAQTSESSTKGTDEQPTTTQEKPKKAWADLGFGSTKHLRQKDSAFLSAPWVPRELQHVGVAEPTVSAIDYEIANSRSKQKDQSTKVLANENVFDAFTNTLSTGLGAAPTIHLPAQWRTNGFKLLETVLQEKSEVAEGRSLLTLRDQIRHGRCAFDRGLPAGPLDWTHAYAPKKATETLQSQSLTLRNWLEKLKVHHVQSKFSNRKPEKQRLKKKRAKKRPSDLDDFLASSDDESENEAPVKNAIIICGPHGCGKTASVFAAAEELDFEVFEIHSGMRRTARDIYDKVGDMTHNHLVQPKASTPRSRASSVVSDSQDDMDELQQPDPKQKSLAAFVGKKLVQNSDIAVVKPVEDKRDSQKQSLILFEEVDVLFEEDKTFWSGVQSLIATSKRPIVLTCNSLDDIPMGDLDVAMILHYETIAVDQAVEYLVHVAACEGYLLQREALRSLYISRGQDLRATLSDLNFWCQMTVGSTLGGLDWMHHDRQSKEDQVQHGSRRMVSKDTFVPHMQLIPDEHHDEQDLLIFAQDGLNLSILDWDRDKSWFSGREASSEPATLQQLADAERVAEARSCMDLFDESILPLMSSMTSKVQSSLSKEVSRNSLAEFILQRPSITCVTRETLANAFEPLTEDMRTFPPPTGRTAPSLDSLSTAIAADIAPYIRHIVQHDQQIERQRGEIDVSSQGTGRQRKTRAARAALEGGSVAGTRVERWYPKDLDFTAVMATGGAWRTADGSEVMRRSLSRQSTETNTTIVD